MRNPGWRLARCLLALTAFAIPASPRRRLQNTPPPRGDPPAVVRPGKLVVATNATLPPVQYIDEKGNLQGMRIELGNEIAKRLGLEINWVNIQFDAQIPGLQGGRWTSSSRALLHPRARQAHVSHPYELQAISVSVPRAIPRRLRSRGSRRRRWRSRSAATRSGRSGASTTSRSRRAPSRWTSRPSTPSRSPIRCCARGSGGGGERGRGGKVLPGQGRVRARHVRHRRLPATVPRSRRTSRRPC